MYIEELIDKLIKKGAFMKDQYVDEFIEKHKIYTHSGDAILISDLKRLLDTLKVQHINSILNISQPIKPSKDL